MTKSPPSRPEVSHRVISALVSSGSMAMYLPSTWVWPWFSATLPGALPTRVISGPSFTSVTVMVKARLSEWPSSSMATTVSS